VSAVDAAGGHSVSVVPLEAYDWLVSCSCGYTWPPRGTQLTERFSSPQLALDAATAHLSHLRAIARIRSAR
jgi:hypothetical protein